METESKIPVVEPVAFTIFPKIVNNPIVIPPNIVAVGMYLLRTE